MLNVADLIKDKKSLLKAITSVHNQGKKYHENLHKVAVSVMLHVANHGQNDVINAFHDGLEEAYKSAFRQWCGRLAGPAEWKDNAWLNYGKPEGKTDRQFFVINDKMKQREEFAKNIDKVLQGKAFFERDPRQGVAQFGDDEILRAIKSLEKRIEKAMADAKEQGKEPAFNPQLVGLVHRVAAEAEAIKPTAH